MEAVERPPSGRSIWRFNWPSCFLATRCCSAGRKMVPFFFSLLLSFAFYLYSILKYLKSRRLQVSGWLETTRFVQDEIGNIILDFKTASREQIRAPSPGRRRTVVYSTASVFSHRREKHGRSSFRWRPVNDLPGVTPSGDLPPPSTPP